MYKRRLRQVSLKRIILWSVLLGLVISVCLHFLVFDRLYDLRLTPPNEQGNITLSNLTVVYTGEPQFPLAFTEPAGMNYILTFDNSSTFPTSAGNYTVLATIVNETYGGIVNATFTILRANQTITITPPLRANYSTGENVSFTVNTTSGQINGFLLDTFSLITPLPYGSLFIDDTNISFTFVSTGIMQVIFFVSHNQNYLPAELRFTITVNGSDYQICTPGSTLACATMNYATTTGYRAMCDSRGITYFHNGTCSYQCATRYVTNGTACVPGGTTFTRSQSLIQVDGAGLFVAPNATNASYIILPVAFAQNRLANISLTIEDPNEDEAYLIIQNLSLGIDETKTVVIKAKRSRSNAVCIADKSSVRTKQQIEDNCQILACPGTNGTYTCEKVDNRLIVTGLRHSGVMEDRIPVVGNQTVILPDSTQTSGTPSGTLLPGVALSGTNTGTSGNGAGANGTSSIVGEESPLLLGADKESTTLSVRLAQIFAGGNETLLYMEFGFFGLIVVLLIVVLFAYSHFARQTSEARAF